MITRMINRSVPPTRAAEAERLWKNECATAYAGGKVK